MFQNNNYGIIGSGDIIDQGNGSYTNGNKFDNNADWDLLWMNFDTTFFQFYETFAAGSSPNYSSGNPTTTLNGVSISVPCNFTPVSMGKSVPSCFNNLKQFYADKNRQEKLINPEGLYFLTENSLTLREQINSDYLSLVNCFDALGRTYQLEAIQVDSKGVIFNIQNLTSGIYYLSFNNKVIKFYKI